MYNFVFIAMYRFEDPASPMSGPQGVYTQSEIPSYVNFVLSDILKCENDPISRRFMPNSGSMSFNILDVQI